MAMNRTMALHEAREGPTSLDEMEAECRALGRNWARAFRAWGPRYAEPLLTLFQAAIFALDEAGRHAAAFDAAHRARAMAFEGRAGWIG